MQRIIIILLFITLNSQLIYSQCNPNQHKDFCVKNLSEGYTFIKSYTNIEIILYDTQHKKIISNYDKKSGGFFPIQYTCTNTGVHYMTFKYHGSGEPCGISVLGFKR